MLHRGRILRDTTTGTGLISANGKQYEFKLEGMWKSDISPKQNMVVEFELDNKGSISSLSAVDETELAKEQAEKAMLAVRTKGLSTISGILSTVGKPILIASGILLASWFFLNTVSLNVYNQNIGINFWNLLGLANSSGGIEGLASLANGGSRGIYGLLAIASLAGPFIYHFWKTNVAHLGNCLPLVTMLLTLFSIGSSAMNASSTTSQFGNQMANEVLKMIHLGAGFYLALIASIYLAFVGTKKYFAGKA